MGLVEERMTLVSDRSVPLINWMVGDVVVDDQVLRLHAAKLIMYAGTKFKITDTGRAALQ